MTREEAREWFKNALNNNDFFPETKDAFKVAIEALSADYVRIEVYRDLYGKYIELKHKTERTPVSVSEKPITKDITRMCNVCRDLGYIGALADEYYHDSTGSDMADEITTYITELFNAIRKSEVEE